MPKAVSQTYRDVSISMSVQKVINLGGYLSGFQITTNTNGAILQPNLLV